MSGSLAAILIAASEPGAARMARALEDCGYAVLLRRAQRPSDVEEALAERDWDVAAYDLASATALPAAEALAFRPGAPPLLAFADEPTPAVTAKALRLGAILCLPGSAPADLCRVVTRARTDAETKRRSRQREAFEAGQREVLELVARGAPRGEILRAIVLLIEAQAEGLAASILLVDAEGRIRHGAAPHLPSAYVEAIDGARIGPHEGSCGAAAATGEPVLIPDIATHPNWDRYRHLALPYGLRASWSTPIFSPEHDVLGTFAMYYREPGLPSDQDLALIRAATHLASVALVRDRDAQRLARSDARFRQVLETTGEGVWMVDVSGTTTYVNRRMAEMLGRRAEDLVGVPVVDLVHEDDRAEFLAHFAERLVGGTEQYELRLTRRDGATLWALVSAGPLLDDDGVVVGGVALIADMTPQREAVAARLRTEAELRLVFEHSALGMALVTPDGRLAKGNPALLRFLGYAQPADLLGRSVAEVTFPDDLPRDAELFEELLAGKRAWYQLEKRYVRRDGVLVWGRLTVSLAADGDGGPRYAIAMIEDITETKRLAKQVRAAERLRSLVFENVSDVVFYLGVEGRERYRFLSVNPAFLRSTGLAESDVVGRLVSEVIPPPTLPMVLDHYRKAIEERRRVSWDEETVYPAGVRYGEVSVTPIFDASGQCTHLVGTVQDVTERRRTEAQIQKQAALLDLARDAILVRAFDGVVRYWNEGATRLYGWTREEALGSSITSLVYRDTNAFEAAMRVVLAEGAWTGELAQRTRDGRPIVVDSSWTLLRDARGAPTAVLSITTDITERKQLEAQVLHAQRMESLGTLAGGVAHDFNNLLGAMVGSVELARRDLPPDHPAVGKLALVDRAAARATDLVQRILTFSREKEPRRALVQVGSLAEEAVRLLQASLPASVVVRAHVDPDTPVVQADAGQVHQVIMNLATNAAQAIGRRVGHIDVAVEPATLTERLVGVATVAEAGRYVRLSVTDDGSGMDDATLARIFDPFFTTKALGEGTGLGLSVVLGIVKAHGGAIRVTSRLRVGTTFEIWLPVSLATSAQTPPQASGPTTTSTPL